MPKQIHEVTDEKKLRRAVQTTQEFNRDRYDSEFISVTAMDPVALAAATIGTTGRPLVLPAGADSYAYHHMGVPKHWGRGSMQIHVWVSCANAAGGDFYLEAYARLLRTDNAAGQMFGTSYPQTQIATTYPAVANTLIKTTFTWDADTFNAETANDNPVEVLTLRIGRVGTSGSDTHGGNAHLWGVRMEFVPKITWAT